MEEIKLSRNQNNAYHTELCFVFYSRKSTSNYTMGQKGTWKRKSKFLSKGRKGQWVLQQEDQSSYISSQWKSNETW